MSPTMDIVPIITRIEAKLTAAERAEQHANEILATRGHTWDLEMAEMDAHFAREEATTEIRRFHALLPVSPMTNPATIERKG
jgi:hypothetical protein